ncbi:hypothetical protein [Rhizobium sp. 18055]|uniref:hypothetical protein n=1 Tax=Rhizobium sp. 18055 TaxID=2681403 RepID=UPI00190F8BB4|nr:hypothetical protein [Rhizobium sp. 18055]
MTAIDTPDITLDLDTAGRIFMAISPNDYRRDSALPDVDLCWRVKWKDWRCSGP